MDITVNPPAVGSPGIVRVPEWAAAYPWLRHGFSTRQGGVSTVYGKPDDLNLGFTKDDDPERVKQNRRLFTDAIAGESGWKMIAVHQVHGTLTKTIRQNEQDVVDEDGRGLFQADGLMTAAPRTLLGIQVADCVPVLVADTRQRVVAAFHAGWRGTAAGIVEQGVARMHTEYASNQSDLVAAIGPSIGACCYSVGEEVRAAFSAAFPYGDSLFARRGDHLYLDLAEANRRQLLSAAIPAGSITVLGECTGCASAGGQRKYFSHRMEQGFTGRAMGAIGVA
jgi:YfiH family protein